MTLYENGNLPAGILESIGSGTDENGYWEWQLTRATIARFRFAQRYALDHFGREIGIRTGWNGYRPLFSQQTARRNACASGNCNGAASPGSSSHGGNWQGRDCLAIDVDPNGLTWAQVWEACRAAGFEVGLITSAMSGIAGGEPWHVIDFNAFGPAPAFGSAVDLLQGGNDSALRRRKEPTMYIKGTSQSDVYEKFTDANGNPALRVCQSGEAAYAASGGLVITGDDPTLMMLAAEAGYGRKILPEIAAPGLEVIVKIAPEIETTYALWGPGYWAETTDPDIANAWARLYGNADNLTYAQWDERKAIATGGSAS